MRVSPLVTGILAGLLVAASSPLARAQGWSADVSVGRIAYEPIALAEASHNAVATLLYEASRGHWIYGTGAAPLRPPDPAWGAVGGGGRFLLPRSTGRRVTIGADLAGEAFLFRDRVIAQSGRGGSLEALPFVRVSRGAASVEAGGGVRGQTVSMAGLTDRRAVFESGLRATYEGLAVRTEGTLRWVRAAEGTFPFVGASVVVGGARAYVTGRAGRWLGETFSSTEWGGGAGVTLGARSTVWVSVRREAPDPLYWNASRRTWSVGLTQRLGARPAAFRPAARDAGGDVVIRLPQSEAAGTDLWIAGDFNGWMPVRMAREGDAWVLRLPLSPGVYKYAFRRGAADWFVPASDPTRRDDGMGGHVAVLVVL